MAESFVDNPAARQRELESYLYDAQPMRDRIVPIAMLIVGGSLYVGRYVMRYHLNGAGFIVLLGTLGLISLVEIVMLVGFAFAVARPLDICFGRVRLAILKFAAIVIFCDGISMIAHASMGSPRGIMGGLPTFHAAFVSLFFLFIFAYLFELSVFESRKVVTILTCFYYAVRVILVVNLAHLVINLGGVPVAPFGNPPPPWEVPQAFQAHH